jgi:hypothetical protein
MSERAAEWMRNTRRELQERVGYLKAGRFRLGKKVQQGGAWVDVDDTAEEIKRLERQIGELDSILTAQPNA